MHTLPLFSHLNFNSQCAWFKELSLPTRTGIGFSLGKEEYLFGYSAGAWMSNPITRTISIAGELKYNPAKFRGLGLYAGFEPALLVAAKQKISGNFDEGKNNIRKDFRSFDLGIVGGINYQFAPRIFIDLRIVNGFRDISRANEYTFVTNKSAQLGLMYSLK